MANFAYEGFAIKHVDFRKKDSQAVLNDLKSILNLCNHFKILVVY